MRRHPYLSPLLMRQYRLRCLYAAQDEVTSIPFPLLGLRGIPIYVDEPDHNVREAVHDVLRFALPDWIMNFVR